MLVYILHCAVERHTQNYGEIQTNQPPTDIALGRYLQTWSKPSSYPPEHDRDFTFSGIISSLTGKIHIVLKMLS